MTGFDSRDDYQPITWISGRPVHATALIVAVYVASLLGTTAAAAFRAGGLLDVLTYSSQAVLHAGAVWQFFTYPLVNPPSLWFAVDMLMLWWFGTELERFFGRRVFLRFYACLVLLTPVLFTLIGLWQPMRIFGVTGNFALFIAFATLYPNVPLLFNILAKWMAAVLVGLQSLIYLADGTAQGWALLISLWATVGFAFAFVRYQQGQWTLPKFALFSRRPKFRVLPSPVAPSPRRGELASSSEVDAVLDKIAKTGLASLTPKERRQLESAREALLKKES